MQAPAIRDKKLINYIQNKNKNTHTPNTSETDHIMVFITKTEIIVDKSWSNYTICLCIPELVLRG